MKYCAKCGAGMSDEASFCPHCGEEVTSASVISNEIAPVITHDIKERSIVVAILLLIVTCGIYGIYWMIKINNEALKLANEHGPSGGVVFLLNIITCGIYSLFWWYKMGNCTDKMKGNPNGNSGILYIVLSILGLGVVNYALVQDAINNTVNGK